MAHEISSMAFTGETPWHGLGNQLTEQQPISVWLKEAGMDWSIQQSDVLFNADSTVLNIRSHSDAKVLYRSDSLEPLSVVSNRYKVVQPKDVLHFYKDLAQSRSLMCEWSTQAICTERHGFETRE